MSLGLGFAAGYSVTSGYFSSAHMNAEIIPLAAAAYAGGALIVSYTLGSVIAEIFEPLKIEY